jgi:hypothetical protein
MLLEALKQLATKTRLEMSCDLRGPQVPTDQMSLLSSRHWHRGTGRPKKSDFVLDAVLHSLSVLDIHSELLPFTQTFPGPCSPCQKSRVEESSANT